MHCEANENKGIKCFMAKFDSDLLLFTGHDKGASNCSVVQHLSGLKHGLSLYRR